MNNSAMRMADVKSSNIEPHHHRRIVQIQGQNSLFPSYAKQKKRAETDIIQWTHHSMSRKNNHESTNTAQSRHKTISAYNFGKLSRQRRKTSESVFSLSCFLDRFWFWRRWLEDRASEVVGRRTANRLFPGCSKISGVTGQRHSWNDNSKQQSMCALSTINVYKC